MYDWASIWPTELSGKFEPVRLLNCGERSTVVQAQDRSGGTAAVKLANNKSRHIVSSKLRKALTLEAGVLNRISDDRIVRLIEAEPDGLYIVLEFLAGGSLFGRYSSRRPTAQQAFECASMIAEALHAIHGAGFLHLDLKPRNILFRDLTISQPVIIDFGSSRPVDKPIGSGTIDPAMLGSGSYLFKAPEQLVHNGNAFSTRTDAFALGVTLYWLLCGVTPFSNTSKVVTIALTKFHQEYKTAIANCRAMNLPVCAVSLIERLLAIEMSNRGLSLGEIAEALGRCAGAAK
jgi:eukaryotic-like serine/threonine-protein kinase